MYPRSIKGADECVWKYGVPHIWWCVIIFPLEPAFSGDNHTGFTYIYHVMFRNAETTWAPRRSASGLHCDEQWGNRRHLQSWSWLQRWTAVRPFPHRGFPFTGRFHTKTWWLKAGVSLGDPNMSVEPSLSQLGAPHHLKEFRLHFCQFPTAETNGREPHHNLWTWVFSNHWSHPFSNLQNVWKKKKLHPNHPIGWEVHTYIHIYIYTYTYIYIYIEYIYIYLYTYNIYIYI